VDHVSICCLFFRPFLLGGGGVILQLHIPFSLFAPLLSNGLPGYAHIAITRFPLSFLSLSSRISHQVKKRRLLYFPLCLCACQMRVFPFCGEPHARVRLLGVFPHLLIGPFFFNPCSGHSRPVGLEIQVRCVADSTWSHSAE